MPSSFLVFFEILLRDGAVIPRQNGHSFVDLSGPEDADGGLSAEVTLEQRAQARATERALSKLQVEASALKADNEGLQARLASAAAACEAYKGSIEQMRARDARHKAWEAMQKMH